MTFLRRLLSSDYRRALAAEAASDFGAAAQLYARCDEPLAVARMHLCRIEPLADAAQRTDGLRETVRWARRGLRQAPDTAYALVAEAGRALAQQARRESPTVAPDAAQLKEAADWLEEAGAFRDAAEALELCGETERAAELWGKAGDLGRMEGLLDRERERRAASFAVAEAWEEAQMALSSGQRDRAAEALARCIAIAPDAQQESYRTRARALDAQLLRESCVTLTDEKGITTVFAGVFPVWLGREGSPGLPLRDPGISRRHACIRWSSGQLELEDCASKNGTRLGGLLISGSIALPEEGEIMLGEDCLLRCTVQAMPGEPTARLELEVVRGLQRGWRLRAQTTPIALTHGVELIFAAGRPWLRTSPGTLRMNGAPAPMRFQLIRGDRLEQGERQWRVE